MLTNIMTTKFERNNTNVVEIIQDGNMLKVISEIKFRSEKIVIEVCIANAYGCSKTMAISTKMSSTFNDRYVVVNKILNEDIFSNSMIDNMNTLSLIADTIASNYRMVKVARGIKGDLEKKIINKNIEKYIQNDYWSSEPPTEMVISVC